MPYLQVRCSDILYTAPLAPIRLDLSKFSEPIKKFNSRKLRVTQPDDPSDEWYVFAPDSPPFTTVQEVIERMIELERILDTEILFYYYRKEIGREAWAKRFLGFHK